MQMASGSLCLGEKLIYPDVLHFSQTNLLLLFGQTEKHGANCSLFVSGSRIARKNLKINVDICERNGYNKDTNSFVSTFFENNEKAVVS